jgi:hypothetical protein
MGDVFLQNRPTYNPLKLLHFLKHVCSTSNNVIFGPLGPAFCPRFLFNGVLEARTWAVIYMLLRPERIIPVAGLLFDIERNELPMFA